MIGWYTWEITSPPRGKILECKRRGDPLSFWVRRELVAPEWNVEGVVWRLADEILQESETVNAAVDKS